MRKINLNREVFICINDKTLGIIRDNIESLSGEGFAEDYMKHCILPKIKNIDGKDYLGLALWEVMSYFGSHINIGIDVPFGTDILIDDSIDEVLKDMY